MPKIPIDVSKLPIEPELLDESLVYHVVVRSCELSETPDKNGNYYLTGLRFEVLEPEEHRKKSAFLNYIRIPSLGQEESDVMGTLGRFIKAFNIPFDQDGIDPADIIGCEGDITVRIEEYQGRKAARVQDFLL